MKATTAEGRRLKRLATAYANAFANWTWRRGGDPEGVPEIEERLKKARRKLFDAIDSLTSIDLTPRGIGDGHP